MDVRIENPGDLIFWTYHMINWKEVVQSSSTQVCVQCGGMMNKIGPVRDPKGRNYDGLVCHTCKRLIWVKSD